MGRQCKRVRKTFEWPLKEIWWGYVLDPISCRTCGGGGKNSVGDYCSTCEGEGNVYPKIEPATYDVDSLPSLFETGTIAEAYGWQMWEDTSEGSPISPIFDNPEDLARWLTDTGASAFGGQTADYEAWLKAVIRGYSPSAVMTISEQEMKLQSGVEGFE